jgi:O-antigen ligase
MSASPLYDNLSKQISLSEPVVKPRARSQVARMLERVIFYALLAAIALTAIPYGTVEPGWEAMFECLVFALGILWIIEAALSGRLLVREHKLLIPLLAILIFGFTQTLPFLRASDPPNLSGSIARAISADPFETWFFELKLLALVVTAALLLRYTSSQKRLRTLIYLAFGIGAASALFGIIRQTMQINPGFFLPKLMPNSGYAQFINYDHFAFLMEMVFGLAVGITVAGGASRGEVLIYLAVGSLAGTALVLSNSRGGIFSLLGQMLILIVLFLRFSLKTSQETETGARWLSLVPSSFLMRMTLILLLIMTTVFGVIWIGGEPLAKRLEVSVSEFVDKPPPAAGVGERANTNRRHVWMATWRLIKAHPIAGVGFCGYSTAIARFHDASGEFVPREAHNDYLELLASGGIIGMSLFVWFGISFVGNAVRHIESADRFARAASIGALVGILGVAVHSLVDFGLHITINGLMFATLLVIATRNVGRVRKRARLRISEGLQMPPASSTSYL